MNQLTKILLKNHKNASAILFTLKEAIENMQDINKIAGLMNKDLSNIYKTFRDSLIHRFEYTFDLAWEYLNNYLKSEGINMAIETPKNTFRESLKATLLSEDEVRLALQMVDHRNLSTHGYDEMLIESISAQIPAYCKLIETILQRTSTLN
ncbi:MAG: HI0074 family nucleotidyltransferase substrate-binding subunit [Candidatus Babeliales bacterium]|jgi:nucleotidyltransferase substrate binding protein (TIGR01987 family)